MVAKTESIALIGTEARLVEVEVEVGGGLPRFQIVGLATASVKEAEQRTRSAIQASAHDWPQSRIIANLAPAGLRKEGTHLDLPIALGILAAAGRIQRDVLEGWLVIGELALDGSLRPVRGTLPAAIACERNHRRGLICPAANAAEAAVIEGLRVIPVHSLSECIDFLAGSWEPAVVKQLPRPTRVSVDDLRDVRGQEIAKNALEIAAAGGHNLLLVGPPGSGKTMLARRLPTILPAMSRDESLEVTRIYSVAGLLGEGVGLVNERPFRSPHHHISQAGLIGGGSGLARPGEVTLAHHGVLFLDELPLFKREALESLRGPLEDGTVRIARSGGAVTYPCRFSLVGAMNPCPCGYEGDNKRRCRCSEREVQVYTGRLSGPLLDRFDILVKLDRLTKSELFGAPRGDSSETIRGRVEQALALQQRRYGCTTLTNASAPQRLLRQSAQVSEGALTFLADAVETLFVTGRGVDRMIRVARTVADLYGSNRVLEEHMGAALQLRFDRFDRGVAA